MLAVFRQRNFFLLWSGSVISSLGDWLLITALPFYIYQRTGSVFATGATYIAETLPVLFFGSLAGIFVDRWNRRWILIVAQLLSAVVAVSLLFIQSHNGLWLVYVVAFFESILAQFINSATSALVPLLVANDQLIAANAANSFGQEITRLIGPSLGGLLLAFSGLSSVILIDSFSFFCCGILISFISLSPPKIPVVSDPSDVFPKKMNLLTEWHEGVSLVRKKPLIAALFLVVSIAMLGEGFGRIIFVPFLKSVIHVNALAFGWVLTVQGVGGILGALSNQRLRKFISPTFLIAGSGMLLGVFNLIAISFPSLPMILLIYLFGGGPVVFFFVGITTLLQQHTPDAYRGRIFGLYGTLNTILLLVGMLLASAFASLLGPRLIFGLMGAFYFLAGLTGYCILRSVSSSNGEDV